MRIGYLRKDTQERFTTKRAWFATAWRIVDPEGNDILQPWFNSKRDALEAAEALQIQLHEASF